MKINSLGLFCPISSYNFQLCTDWYLVVEKVSKYAILAFIVAMYTIGVCEVSDLSGKALD